MAWTTPTTVSTGDVLTASRYNADVQANLAELAPFFSAWTTYTPTIKQGATSDLAKTTNVGRYLKVGRLAIVQFRLDVTGSNANTGDVIVTLPSAVVPTSTVSGGNFGYGSVFDNSTSTQYSGTWRASSTTEIKFQSDATGTQFWGTGPAVAITTSDQLHGTFITETTT